MKNKKSILIIIFSLIILGVGLYFLNSEKNDTKSEISDSNTAVNNSKIQTSHSAEDVLRDVDFNTEEPSVELKKIDFEGEDMFVPIELTDETQQVLIKAFEKSKFKKDSDYIGISHDYRMTMTLNRGYVMFLDIIKKGIIVRDVDGSSEEYVIEDDEGFFSILEKTVTE